MKGKAANRPRADRSGEAVETGPRWRQFGLAALLGTMAGTMLFATRAEGRVEDRRTPARRPESRRSPFGTMP